MIYLLPFLMAFLARLSGGGYFASKIWSRLPELVFAWVFAIVSLSIGGDLITALIVWVVTYFAFEMGHGTFYGMNGYYPDYEPRKQSLEYVVRPIFKALKLDIYSPIYSWVCMGIKGALIGCVSIYASIALAVLWPLGYWLGHQYLKKPEYAEYITGFFAGVVLLCLILN